MATATITLPDASGGSGRLKVSITYSVTNTDTTHKMTATKVKYTAVGAGWYFDGSKRVTYAGTTLHTPPEQTLAEGKSKSYTISKSVSTTKTHSTQAKNFVYTYSTSFYTTIVVPAKTSYTVAFNANGGSGAPSSQTKWYGETLTLSSTKPTRSGYTFQNWNTTAGATAAGTSYASGGSYTANSAATLYAQWKANTYTVSYNANGGSGAPASQVKTHGVNLVLSTAKPTRAGYSFAGWNTSPTASDVTYASGATYTANAALSLHAIWKPVISATLTLSARCSDAACTVEDEDGGYVQATVNWSCPVSVTSSSLSVKQDSGLTVGAYDFTAGTSGSYSAVISGFDPDKSYPITATFSTGTGSGYMAGSQAVVKTASGAVYILDFNGKTGVGIGIAAPDDGLWVAHDLHMRNGRNIHWDAVEDYAVPVSESIYRCAMLSNDGAGNRIGYSELARTSAMVYRSFAVTNPKPGSAGVVSIYLRSYDDGTKELDATSGAAWAIANGGSGQTGSTSTTTVSQILTAGSGVTLVGANYAQWGKVATLFVTMKYSSAISSGNITNITIGTLVSGKRPKVTSPFSLATTGPVIQGYIGTSGNIVLAATGGTISANSEFDIAATYVLA